MAEVFVNANNLTKRKESLFVKNCLEFKSFLKQVPADSDRQLFRCSCILPAKNENFQKIDKFNYISDWIECTKIATLKRRISYEDDIGLPIDPSSEGSGTFVTLNSESHTMKLEQWSLYQKMSLKMR